MKIEPPIVCETADDFIKELQPTNPKWESKQNGLKDGTLPFIFRGEGHDGHEYVLLPSAWREPPEPTPLVKRSLARNIEQSLKSLIDWNQKEHYLEHVKTLKLYLQDEARLSYLTNIMVNVNTERSYVRQFHKLADSLGFQLPELIDPDYQFSNQKMTNYLSDLILHRHQLINWWNQEIIPIAQHHGIATRYLDWTSSPLIAAFFAAQDARDDLTSSDYIVVHAVWRVQNNNNTNSGMVSIRNSLNRFIHAQQGVFSVNYHGDAFYSQHGIYPTIEQSKSALFHMKKYKIIAKKSLASEILDMLMFYKISKAHLMPTLDNVALTVKSMNI